MEGRRWALLLAVAALAGCRPEASGSEAQPDAVTSARSPVATVSSPRKAEPPPTEPADPVFFGTSRRIGAGTRSRMTSSWRPGCPVPLEDLRLLSLDHWGFDDDIHRGELVVHEDQAAKVLEAFSALFDSRFPIRRMNLVDQYAADDDRSMAANNTSAFNCRPVTGGSSWSEHSYGRAIDINPIQNPYVSGGTVLPPAGARFADRSLRAKGMIRSGEVVVRAFASIGWKWGGHWSSIKDYQHFSKTGR